nr:hypothetical protein Iba_scaffold601821CG0010 [Ipomoea batatas]GME13757.1 hypothetical protein Iba_scaffold14647CG0290 [Ipomoea batatas]
MTPPESGFLLGLPRFLLLLSSPLGTAKAFSPSNCYNEEQREVCRIEQPPERGIIDAAREWIPLLTEFSIRDRRSLSPPPSNSFNEEREVCRVEQSPERGVDDTAGAWVSTRNRRISVVDGVSHRTAQPPTVNTAFSSTAHGRFQSLEPVGAFCCQNWVAASIRH